MWKTKMYKLRICGTNEFVSKIDPKYAMCYPLGRVELVVGWTHPRVKVYPTLTGAKRAAKLVEKIEGCICDIEEVR
jgi:hypothetical protein